MSRTTDWLETLTPDERAMLNDPISQVLFGDPDYRAWFWRNVGKPAAEQEPWTGSEFPEATR